MAVITVHGRRWLNHCGEKAVLYSYHRGGWHCAAVPRSWRADRAALRSAAPV